MNNTDFFNDNRVEALKLIAESVYPGSEVTILSGWLGGSDSCRVSSLYSGPHSSLAGEFMVANSYEELSDAELPLKNSAWMDVVQAIKRYLDNFGERDWMRYSKMEKDERLSKALESPEAACVMYLDIIRKV